MVVIGDVHGKISEYKAIINTYIHESSIQVGDMGIGFPGIKVPIMPRRHSFIRGNHDSPDAARKHPNYMGDWGVYHLDDTKNTKNDIFFVSGAWSIDAGSRLMGVSWWPEEELNYTQFDEAIRSFIDIKPRIVITHDCPESAAIGLGLIKCRGGKAYHSKTSLALQAMFDIYQPELWIFGHWHESVKDTILGTKFICLNELETYEI